ncbi:MAG: zf-HC2 domain-containing protein [Deltaproteobacteria bacterium]|nr:zf-HC2 domain-containing protein [Deltaproteobacteria bacterium]MCK5710605.1 zf-HC2 domain-containing protein [Deltaproteobacteria bacterium]
MECKDLKELLTQYSLDDLGRVEKVGVERHLEECNECKLYLSQSQELWSLLDTWDEIEPDGKFVSNFWDKTSIEETKLQPGFLSKFRNLKPNWSLAGAMASIFLVSILTFAVFSPDTTNTLYTSADEQDELILIELDNALSRETSDVLSIYGPWESTLDVSGNGDMN